MLPSRSCSTSTTNIPMEITMTVTQILDILFPRNDDDSMYYYDIHQEGVRMELRHAAPTPKGVFMTYLEVFVKGMVRRLGNSDGVVLVSDISLVDFESLQNTMRNALDMYPMIDNDLQMDDPMVFDVHSFVADAPDDTSHDVEDFGVRFGDKWVMRFKAS